MEREKISTLIFERLAASTPYNDVVMEVCDLAGLDWPEAEAMVQQVMQEQGHEMTRRQSPLLFVIAAIIFIMGAALFINSISDIIKMILFFNGRGQDLSLLELPLWMMNMPYLLPEALLGIAMMAGSLIGLRDVWSAIFEKWLD